MGPARGDQLGLQVLLKGHGVVAFPFTAGVHQGDGSHLRGVQQNLPGLRLAFQLCEVTGLEFKPTRWVVPVPALKGAAGGYLP